MSEKKKFPPPSKKKFPSREGFEIVVRNDPWTETRADGSTLAHKAFVFAHPVGEAFPTFEGYGDTTEDAWADCVAKIDRYLAALKAEARTP